MKAIDIKNKIKSNRTQGSRIFPEPPKEYLKREKDEWNRLSNSLHITEKDIGLLTLTVSSFSTFQEFDKAIHTRIEIDPVTKKSKSYKRTMAEYLLTHANSQNQVELSNKAKAHESYLKSIKLLNALCPLTNTVKNPTESEEEDLLSELL
jgi:hypothetical protein